MAILLGMAFGGMVATSLRALVILILGTWLFQIPLGMLFASLFLLYGRDAWQITEILREPVYFLSGFYFPVNNFGFTIGLVVSISR